MNDHFAILAAFLLGAWVSQRARTGQSPLPDVAKSLGGLIEVFKRKPKEQKTAVPMPRMKA